MKCVSRQGHHGGDPQRRLWQPHIFSRWWAKLSDELSTGPQLWPMRKNSSESAKDANTSPSNNMSQPTS
jgi:hypothetical protein